MQIVNPDLPNEKFLNTPENILLNIKKKAKRNFRSNQND